MSNGEGTSGTEPPDDDDPAVPVKRRADDSGEKGGESRTGDHRPGEQSDGVGATESPPGAGENGVLPATVRSAVPSPIRRRLLAKVVFGVVVATLLIGVVSLFFYAGISGEVDQQADTQIRDMTEMQTHLYRSWIEDQREDLESIGNRDLVASEDTEQLGSMLNDEAISHDEFESFHVVDRNTGEVVASSRSDAVGTELGPKLGDGRLQSNAFITPHQYESVTGETVVAMGYRPADAGSRVIVGEIDGTAGGPSAGGSDDGSRVVVTDRDGEVVFGADSVGEGVVDDSGMEVTVSDLDGNRYATNRIGGTNLYVVTETPHEQVFAVSESVRWSFLLMVLLTVGIVTGLGVVGGRSVERSVATLSEKARQMESGSLDVQFATPREDEIGTLYDRFDAMRDSLQERIEEAEAARQRAEQAREDAEAERERAQTLRSEAESERERVEAMNETIEAAAAHYSEVLQAAADGDLTARMDVDTDNQAMTSIATEFNEMMGELQRTIDDVSTFADEVAAASQEVTGASREVQSGSRDVATAVQEIADGADEQRESLQTVTEEMEDLSSTVEEIAASSDQVATVAEQTAATSETGRDAATEAIEGMEVIAEESSEAVTEIRTLQEEVEAVDELIARIGEIADQTSILALNANIEAARAAGGTDGAGDGFGVVAREVKELSEDAKDAAQEVEDRLERIRTQTDLAATAVESTRTGIETHTDSVENAAEALESVAEYAEETNEGVQEIAAGTDQQAVTTEEVVAMVDQVADIAAENSGTAADAAATAEEQTAAMDDVAESTSELAEQSERLSETLDRFVTESDETEMEACDDEQDEIETADADDERPAIESPDAGAAEVDVDAVDESNDGPADRVASQEGGPVGEPDGGTRTDSENDD